MFPILDIVHNTELLLLSPNNTIARAFSPTHHFPQFYTKYIIEHHINKKSSIKRTDNTLGVKYPQCNAADLSYGSVI